MTMESLDLSDPGVLRRLMTQDDGNDTPSPFITELLTMEDSDVELENEDDDDDDHDDDGGDATANQSREETAVRRDGITTPPTLHFTGATGLQIQMDTGSTPLDYFNLMVTDAMIENIATETNRYATNSLRGKTLSPSSRFKKWVEVTTNEMYAFLGLIIAMGLIIIKDRDDYWSTNAIYSLPMFRSVMRRDRFCLIMSFLHLANNEEELPRTHPDHDPLFKIQQFIQPLIDNFRSVFIPERRVAIDEAMIAWRGHLSFRCYNPDKPDKFGIKMFELCDCDTGYCSNLQFYTGRRESFSMGATFDVVRDLMTPYLGSGRTLYVDNYYTSHGLFTFLRHNNTLPCGTLRLNRRNGPPKQLIPKLKKRDSRTYILTNGTLNLIRFFDKREVNLLTTAHDASTVDTAFYIL